MLTPAACGVWRCRTLMLHVTRTLMLNEHKHAHVVLNTLRTGAEHAEWGRIAAILAAPAGGGWRVSLLAAAVALRVGAGNDLGNLLGDGGLARPVHLRRDKGDVRKRAH
jgi:hypothetical protein